MKVRVTMKHPDCVSDAIQEAARASVSELELGDNERDLLVESREADIESKLSRWIEYNEYIRIEFDLDAMTATVLPVKP